MNVKGLIQGLESLARRLDQRAKEVMDEATWVRTLALEMKVNPTPSSGAEATESSWDRLTRAKAKVHQEMDELLDMLAALEGLAEMQAQEGFRPPSGEASPPMHWVAPGPNQRCLTCGQLMPASPGTEQTREPTT